MMARYRVRDRLPYFKINQAIHSAILRAAGNESLRDLHGILQARLKRIRYLGHEGPQNWAAAVADHEEIIVALEARDADLLVAALTNHMVRAWERVKSLL